MLESLAGQAAVRQKNAVFKASKVWKGNVSENVAVYSEDGCYCTGHYFELGATQIVFARKNAEATPMKAGYVSEACDGPDLEMEALTKKLDSYFHR